MAQGFVASKACLDVCFKHWSLKGERSDDLSECKRSLFQISLLENFLPWTCLAGYGRKLFVMKSIDKEPPTNFIYCFFCVFAPLVKFFIPWMHRDYDDVDYFLEVGHLSEIKRIQNRRGESLGRQCKSCRSHYHKLHPLYHPSRLWRHSKAI